MAAVPQHIAVRLGLTGGVTVFDSISRLCLETEAQPQGQFKFKTESQRLSAVCCGTAAKVHPTREWLAPQLCNRATGRAHHGW